MRNKKKLIISVLSMMALFSLASCVSEKSTSKVPTETTTQTIPPSTPSTTITPITTTETEVEYEFKEFRWASDFSNALLVMKDKNNNEKTIDATVTFIKAEPTCEAKGKITYSASATYNGESFNDTKELSLDAIGHDWKFKNFEWAEDGSSAKAIYVCSRNSEHIVKYDAAITSEKIEDSTCISKGKTKYTATYDDNTDEKIIEDININPNAHDLTFKNFEWAEDRSSAKAIYVCSRNSEHIVKYDAAITSEKIEDPTCTTKGKTKYTATYDNESDTITIDDIQALGHNYIFSEFIWDTSKEPYTAKAKYGCSNNSSHIEYSDAQIQYEIVTEPTEDAVGVGRYTATYDGHTDSKDVTIPKIASYIFSEFVWDTSKEPYTAKAKYIGSTDSTNIKYYDASISYEETLAPKCETTGMGKYIATYDGHTDSKEKTIPAIGHNWDYGNITWNWSANYSSATATIKCKNDINHENNIIALVTSTTTATCTNAGIKTYTATIIVGNQNYIDTKSVDDSAKGHEWGTPSYSWSEDRTKVTATIVCKNNENHKEIETVNVTVSSKTLATKTTTGSATYIATFTNPLFENQTKSVNLYYVAFVDNDGNPTSSDNERFDVEENSIISYTPVSGTYNGQSWTFNNPIIDTGLSRYETYIFNGWMANGDTTIVDLTTLKIAQNIIFNPRYTKYTVTKNIDGGEIGDMFESDILTSALETIPSISGSTKNGYMFLGWYQTINGETTPIKIPTGQSRKTNYMTSTNYRIDGLNDVVIEARWMALPITITNDTPSYGKIIGVPLYSWINNNITISTTTNEGYIFKGFYSGSELAQKDVNTGLPLSEFKITMSTDTSINYEAIWVEGFITFNVNDSTLGTISSIEDYVYGETKTITATPKSGYSFVKWQKGGVDYADTPSINVTFTEDNAGEYVAIFKSATIKTNVLLYNFASEEYELSSEPGSINDNQYSTATSVTIGSNLTFIISTNEGYTFQGLYINNEKLTSNDYVMPDNDVIVEARYIAYTVTTTNNNPTYGTISVYTNEKVTKGTNFTINATPNVGYSFLGWYTSVDSATPISTLTSWTFTMGEENLSYVAKFACYKITISVDDDSHGTVSGLNVSNVVEVNFNLNGGALDGVTGDIEQQYVTLETALPYPGVVTKPNYVFNGWYTNIECTEKFDFSSTINSDITLYAGYTPMYNDNSYNTQEYADLFRNNNTESKAYSLLLDGSSESKTNNLYFTCYQAGNITIYAKSTSTESANTNHIRVYNITNSKTEIIGYLDTSDQSYNVVNTFAVNEGDIICIKDYITSSSINVKTRIYVTGNTLPVSQATCGALTYNDTNITAGTEVTLIATPKAGYTFVGWYVSGTTTNPVTTNPWVFAMGNENLNYYAKFTKYTLTTVTEFKDSQVAGELVSNYTNEPITAETIVKLKATLNSGFTFLGWYKFGDTTPISTKLEYEIEMPNENVEYIARYTYYELTISSDNFLHGTVGGVSEGNYVTVSFEMNGAIESYPYQIITPSVALNYPGNPKKAGYIFTGWYSNSLCTELFDFGKDLTSDTIIYAGFTQLPNSGNAVDITEDNIYKISESSTKTYEYFTTPISGTYVMYYRLSANVQVNLLFKKLHSSTNIINEGIGRPNDNYFTAFINANAGDVYMIESYQPDNTSVQLEYYIKYMDNDVEVVPHNPVSIALCGPITYTNKKLTGGTNAVLVATPKQGYSFFGWYKDGDTNPISTELEYSIVIGKETDGVYVAKFESQ